MHNVTGVVHIGRNPKQLPDADTVPAIQIYELEDKVVEVHGRGGHPVYRRVLTVVLQLYISAEKEGAATQELADFVKEMKKKLYEGGPNLSRKCLLIEETRKTRVFRPATGSNMAAIGIALEITYKEDISLLMT